MLKILGSIKSTTRPGKRRVSVGGDNIDGDGDCNGNFDMTIHVTRWRSRYCLPAKMVDFDYVSDADHQ